MSDLRDARFQRALDLAPDVDLHVGAQTRHTIHAAAHGAVAPAARASWWGRWWPDLSVQRGPVNAVFATLLLASLVTLLWHDREIPGARTDPPAAVEPVSRDAPAALPAPAPVIAPPVLPSRTTGGLAGAAGRKAVRAPRDDLMKDMEKQTGVAPPTAQPLTDDAPPRTEERARADAFAAPRAALAPVPAAPPVAPAMAAAPATRALAPVAGSAIQVQISPANTATHLRIASQGHSVEVPMERSSRLAELISRAVHDAQSAEPLGMPVTIRVELRRQSEPAGVLELAGPQVRWTGLRGGESYSLTARPDAVLLQALREELNSLLAR